MYSYLPYLYTDFTKFSKLKAAKFFILNNESDVSFVKFFFSKAAYASWQAGPGFVTGSGKPIIVLDSFCNWNPFPDDPNDEGRKSSVNLKCY